MELQTIPLGELKPGKTLNARKAKTELNGLKQSIERNGLLVPLIVQRSVDAGFVVIAGNRRLACLTQLFSDTNLIPCVVIPIDTKPKLLEISRVENVDREPLHPVDEFEVFHEQVQRGDTIEDITKRTGYTAGQVRQTLALASMAKEVRDAWREGKINAETAEAFTITTDHAAQVKALKKHGKSPNRYVITRELSASQLSGPVLLKFVGEAYEKAGHTINTTLFAHGQDDDVAVSSFPDLVAMCQAKLEQHCAELIKKGWAWAITEQDAPKDLNAWKRHHIDKPTAEQRAGIGCVVKIGWNGQVDVQSGYVKPGDKVKIERSPAEKKKADSVRAERQDESGGISNALAWKLSHQLTLAIREGMRTIKGKDALALAASLLACRSEATPSLCVSVDHEVENDRHNRDLPKYFKGSADNAAPLIMEWLALAVHLRANSGAGLASYLHPTKTDNKDVKFIVSLIDDKAFAAAVRKNFDAFEYFNGVARPMVIDALVEMDPKTPKNTTAKKGELVEAAVALAKKHGWVPPQLRAK